MGQTKKTSSTSSQLLIGLFMQETPGPDRDELLLASLLG